jgi:hypothetical protein
LPFFAATRTCFPFRMPRSGLVGRKNVKADLTKQVRMTASKTSPDGRPGLF